MSDWRTVRLAEILEPVHRPTPIAEGTLHTTLGVRWYGAGCFVKTDTPVKAKTLNRVATGDVVYSKLFAWKGSFGVVPASMDEVLASTEFPTFRSERSFLLPGFFELWAGRTELWDTVDALSTGTTGNSRNRLAPEDFLDLEIDLPPIAEQQAVLRALAPLASTERLEARVRKTAEQGFDACRRERIESLRDDFAAIPIREFTEIRSGGTPSRSEPTYFGGGIPWVKTGEVAFGPIDATEETLTVHGLSSSSARLLPAMTVLVAMYGRGTVGRSAYITTEMATNQACAAVLPGSRHDPLYLFHYLWASYFDLVEEAEGTTNLTNISLGIVGSFEVPLPDLRRQRAFAAEMEAHVSVIQAVKRTIRAYRGLRTALIEELVTGVRSAPRLARAA